MDDNNNSGTGAVDLYCGQKVNERHCNLKHYIWGRCDRLLVHIVSGMGNKSSYYRDSLASIGFRMACEGTYERKKQESLIKL